MWCHVTRLRLKFLKLSWRFWFFIHEKELNKRWKFINDTWLVRHFLSLVGFVFIWIGWHLSRVMSSCLSLNRSSFVVFGSLTRLQSLLLSFVVAFLRIEAFYFLRSNHFFLQLTLRSSIYITPLVSSYNFQKCINSFGSTLTKTPFCYDFYISNFLLMLPKLCKSYKFNDFKFSLVILHLGAGVMFILLATLLLGFCWIEVGGFSPNSEKLNLSKIHITFGFYVYFIASHGSLPVIHKSLSVKQNYRKIVIWM